MSKFNPVLLEESYLGRQGKLDQPIFESDEKKYQDWPFAILFIVNFGVIFVLMASLGVNAVKSNNNLRDSLSDSNMKNLAGVASAMATLAMTVAVMMTKMILSYARGMIIFVLWSNFGVAITFAGIGIAIGDYILVGVGVIIAILNWCYARSVKHRIPLALAQLRIAEAAISKNTATYVVAVVFAILQIIWVIMWSLALLGVISYFSKENASSTTTADSTLTHLGGYYRWVYTLLLLSFYWGIQVFKNVVHTTIAGTVAAFWYQMESASTTTSSLKRATTTSFGSICFGSLIVALLQTLHEVRSVRILIYNSVAESHRAFSQLAMNRRKSRGAAACIAECLLSFLESIMKYFNRWAYIYVGIYGYSFMQAGSSVSQLFLQRGFTALVNDDLVRIVIRLTAIGVGLICAGVGAVVAELSDAFTFESSTTLLAILGFVVGFSVALTPLAVISSSVATIFVCFAEVSRSSIDTQTDWGFKALKRIVKLLFELQRHDEAMRRLNGVCYLLLQRLWFKTSVKLGNLLYEIGDFSRLTKIIKELLASCSDEDADDGVRKNSQLLEVYALQIQMYTAQKDNKKLVSIYEKALRTKSGVAHPKIIGVIHECGGKMYMMQREWDKARSDFFSGFKSYDEAGEPRRLQCLKYLVLANMLSESQVNVFDSQEAKPYENDKEIVAMTKLTDAFLHDEIKTFEQVLNRNQETIMDDPFIKHYIDSLLRTIRSKVLLKIIKPYRRMDTQYIARELNGIPLSEVESLLSALVLDKKIEARIDQVHHTLVLLDRKPEEKFQTSIQGWCDALDKFHSLTMDGSALACEKTCSVLMNFNVLQKTTLLRLIGMCMLS
ncbi:PCI/PINT associated module [Phytophthora cactorum]|nr:PCI/PINT associated module [Phytophthora cactorum]